MSGEFDVRPVEGDEPHYYRVDRMLDAALGTRSFDPPDDVDIPDWFDLSEYERTVRVRLAADALNSLPSPHQLGDATQLGDGRVELDITVSGDRERYLLIRRDLHDAAFAADRCGHI